MMICINTYKISKNNFFTFLGIAYGFVAILQLFFILTTIPDGEIWLNKGLMCGGFLSLSRYVEAISLIISTQYLNSKGKVIDVGKVIYKFTGIIIFISLVNVKIWNKILEISNPEIIKYIITLNNSIIIILLLIAISRINIGKNNMGSKNFKLIKYSIGFNILSVTFITSLSIRPSIVNVYTSIIFKFISVFIIYIIIGENSLRNPYEYMFSEIYDKSMKLEEVNKTLYLQNKELEHAKKDLEDSKEQYKMIFDFLPEPTIDIKDNKIYFANRAAANILKANRYEILEGKNILDIIHKDFKEYAQYRINELKNGRDMMPYKKQRFVDMEGKDFEVEVSSRTCILNGETHLLCVFRDIEEKKKIEELRNEFMQSMAEEKLKIQFFSNVSHELKTPINVIYTALQMEDVYIQNGDIENLSRYNEMLKANCLRLMRLSSNLIDVTAVESGYYKPKFTSLDAVKFIEDLTLEASKYVEDKKMNLSIVFDTYVEERFIVCDKNLLERIVLNLISNGVKFSKANGHVLVTLYDNGDGISISVKDDGVGIPKGNNEYIFEKLSKVDKSFNRLTEGSGIGLSLVKNFVEILGGNIEVMSEKDAGSEFMVTLYDLAGIDMDTSTVIENRSLREKVEIEFSDIYI